MDININNYKINRTYDELINERDKLITSDINYNNSTQMVDNNTINNNTISDMAIKGIQECGLLSKLF